MITQENRKDGVALLRKFSDKDLEILEKSCRKQYLGEGSNDLYFLTSGFDDGRKLLTLIQDARKTVASDLRESMHDIAEAGVEENIADMISGFMFEETGTKPAREAEEVEEGQPIEQEVKEKEQRVPEDSGKHLKDLKAGEQSTVKEGAIEHAPIHQKMINFSTEAKEFIDSFDAKHKQEIIAAAISEDSSKLDIPVKRLNELRDKLVELMPLHKDAMGEFYVQAATRTYLHDALLASANEQEALTAVGLLGNHYSASYIRDIGAEKIIADRGWTQVQEEIQGIITH